MERLERVKFRLKKRLDDLPDDDDELTRAKEDAYKDVLKIVEEIKESEARKVAEYYGHD